MREVKSEMVYDFGGLKLNINKLLKENNISKNKICKDLDLPRYTFNKYCRNEFQRLDANLLCKLCYYFEIEISDLIEYISPKEDK